MGVIIKFEDFKDSSTIDVTSFFDDINSYLIEIDITNPEMVGGGGIIHLDIETAVKFSKELRRQIAIAKDNQLKFEENE